jgi:hypothetical protein
MPERSRTSTIYLRDDMPQTKELTREQVRDLTRTIEAAPTLDALDTIARSIEQDFATSPAQRLANELALRDLREAIAARREFVAASR